MDCEALLTHASKQNPKNFSPIFVPTRLAGIERKLFQVILKDFAGLLIFRIVGTAFYFIFSTQGIAGKSPNKAQSKPRPSSKTCDFRGLFLCLFQGPRIGPKPRSPNLDLIVWLRVVASMLPVGCHRCLLLRDCMRNVTTKALPYDGLSHKRLP